MIQTIVSIINTGVIILNVMFPTLFKRVGQTVTNQEANTKLSQKEIQKLIELEIELQKHGISACYEYS